MPSGDVVLRVLLGALCVLTIAGTIAMLVLVLRSGKGR